MPEKVYTDGAVYGNGLPYGQCGLGVYWPESSHLNVSKLLEDATNSKRTNQRAELNAILCALETILAEKKRDVVIYSDSMYSISAITSWVKKWKKNGWKTGTDEDVKNKEDLVAIDNIMELLKKRGANVAFKHVKGHVKFDRTIDHDCNDEADRLAKAPLKDFRCAPKPSVEEGTKKKKKC